MNMVFGEIQYIPLLSTVGTLGKDDIHKILSNFGKGREL
jgi:hypothetical protein